MNELMRTNKHCPRLGAAGTQRFILWLESLASEAHVGGTNTRAMKRITIPQIRRATSADAELLADLGGRTFSDTFALDNTPEDMAAYLSSSFSPALQAEGLADPRVMFLIAEIEGVAGGYAKMESSSPPSYIAKPNPIELSRLYVSKELIGTGVGAALMEACIRKAKEAGFRTIWLGVWEKNERAQKFYQKWGFQAVGEQVFRLGGDEQRDLVMEREV